MASRLTDDDGITSTIDHCQKREIPAWPTKPTKLVDLNKLEILSLVGDVALLLLALSFTGTYFPATN
jgi:hypothetical protein